MELTGLTADNKYGIFMLRRQPALHMRYHAAKPLVLLKWPSVDPKTP